MKSIDYAKQWNINAMEYTAKHLYKKFASSISDYHKVLEIGCGTGESTLELLKQGHYVVVVDNNADCVSMAQKKLVDAGYKSEDDFEFITGNFFDQDIIKYLSSIKVDVIICWNPSAFTNPEEVEYDKKCFSELLCFLSEEIESDFNCTYCEALQRLVLLYSKKYSIPAQLVDRAINVDEVGNYYEKLNDYFRLGKFNY